MSELFSSYGDGPLRATSETVKRIRDLEIDGYSVQESAARLGVHRSTVAKYRLEKGPSSRAGLSEEKQDELRRLRAEGLTTSEIARRTGVSRNSVLKYAGAVPPLDWNFVRLAIGKLEEAGIFSRREQSKMLGIRYQRLIEHIGPSRWSQVTTKDIQEIRRRYYHGEYAKDIAMDYGCSSSTIYNVVNRKDRYAHI